MKLVSSKIASPFQPFNTPNMPTGSPIAMSSGGGIQSADMGVLVIGHGSREQASIDEFLTFTRLVAAAVRPAMVEACFLEFARPTIADGFRALAARGARRIVAAPTLLFSAGHARRDIPATLASVAVEYPHITVTQSEHLGCHDSILALSKRRYEETVQGRAPVADDRTALVLVGRGSDEPTATAEMERFALLRLEASGLAHGAACFLSMAEPRLETVLDRMARSGAKRVVVQPHLLFCGVLFDRACATVARYCTEHPEVEWLTVSYLGPAAGVVQALVDRAEATRIPVSG